MAGGRRLGAQLRLEGDRCGLKLSWRAGRLCGQSWYWSGVMYRGGHIRQWRVKVRRDPGPLRPGLVVQVLRLYAAAGIMPAREVAWNWYPPGFRYYPPDPA